MKLLAPVKLRVPETTLLVSATMPCTTEYTMVRYTDFDHHASTDSMMAILATCRPLHQTPIACRSHCPHRRRAMSDAPCPIDLFGHSRTQRLASSVLGSSPPQQQDRSDSKRPHNRTILTPGILPIEAPLRHVLELQRPAFTSRTHHTAIHQRRLYSVHACRRPRLGQITISHIDHV